MFFRKAVREEAAKVKSQKPAQQGLPNSVEAPLVSIVTVSYNQADFLIECMESVLSQSYPHIEYIIIDGGSTDNAVPIIESYAHRLAYWHSRPDDGAADALNQGFERAHGSIYACLNSDDILKPGTVQQWVETFAQHPSADLVYGDLEIIDAQGRPSHLPGKRVSVFRAGRWSLRSHAADALVIPQQSSSWRSEVHSALGGFNVANKSCWDGEFFATAAMRGFKFQQIPKVLASFRVHHTSISGTGRLEEMFRADQARIATKWVEHGLAVLKVEQIVRKFLIRVHRFFRQPSALLAFRKFRH